MRHGPSDFNCRRTEFQEIRRTTSSNYCRIRTLPQRPHYYSIKQLHATISIAVGILLTLFGCDFCEAFIFPINRNFDININIAIAPSSLTSFHTSYTQKQAFSRPGQDHPKLTTTATTSRRHQKYVPQLQLQVIPSPSVASASVAVMETFHQLLESHPLALQAVTASCFSGMGDILAQLFAPPDNAYDNDNDGAHDDKESATHQKAAAVPLVLAHQNQNQQHHHHHSASTTTATSIATATPSHSHSHSQSQVITLTKSTTTKSKSHKLYMFFSKVLPPSFFLPLKTSRHHLLQKFFPTTRTIDIDTQRTLRLMLSGLGSGFLWAQWYILADQWTDRAMTAIVFAQSATTLAVIRTVLSLLLDQFVGSPILYAIWDIPVPLLLVSLATTTTCNTNANNNSQPQPHQHHNRLRYVFRTIPQEVAKLLPILLVENAKIYTIVNILVYNIPVQYRVMVTCFADIVFQAVLSQQVSDSQQHKTTIIKDDDLYYLSSTAEAAAVATTSSRRNSKTSTGSKSPSSPAVVAVVMVNTTTTAEEEEENPSDIVSTERKKND